MRNENKKSDLDRHISMAEMARMKQLCEQYINHINPPHKKTDDLTYLELLKLRIMRDLLRNVTEPKTLLTILQAKSDDPHFSNRSNADVLRMNRSSPVGLFFKMLLVFITFPVSLPLLMLWSFATKRTLDFLKADGAIFLEELIPLCTNWVEPPPNPTSANIPTPLTNPTLRRPFLMPSRNQLPHNKETALVPQGPKTLAQKEPIELQRVKNPDLKNMSRLATQMAGVFGGPRFAIDQTLSRFKGQAMIIASDPIRPVGVRDPNALRLAFTCQLMYTDAPVERCEITVFKTFSPMAPVAPPSQGAIASITTARQNQTETNWMQRGQLYCLSFFEDNFRSAMQKGHENVGKERANDLLTTVKYYQRALTLATTDLEKLLAIEAIINSINDSRKFFKGGTPPNFELHLQKRTKEALCQLPPNYRLLSEDIKHTTALYRTIWLYLETNEPKKAWMLFKSMTLSHFLKKSCPELYAMHCQLYAVFKINGEDAQLEDGALTAVYGLSLAFSNLSQQNYSLCLMTEYVPSLGATPGKLYLAETMDGPLHYVIRNGNDTEDWAGTITQEEIILNRIRMGYSRGCSEDFIWKLEDQISIIIAVIAEKGHAQQSCTPEARLMRELAIKPMGQMQRLAAEAWDKTPFEKGRARAYALEDSKNDQVWRGYSPSIRVDRELEYLSKQRLFINQWCGATDPSLRYSDDDLMIDEEHKNASI